MRLVPVYLAFATLLGSVACGGGSGVDGGRPVTQLDNAEYTKLCTYYNQKADEISMKTCSSNMKQPMINRMPCGTTNALKGHGECALKVSDVESCINGTNACTATGAESVPS